MYDGGLTTSVWSSDRADSPHKFVVGETVYMLDDTQNIVSRVIMTPPTALSKWYTIKLGPLRKSLIIWF